AAIEKVAPTKSAVLITGESGTGKELVARAIHFTGARKDKPFVAVQCAAIPETLMESELFGHEKGSFTDATSRQLGKFELANQGTLFLDEIGEMNPAIQAKMLRVLEQQEITRVGGAKTIAIDVRVVAATNRDLKKAIQEGSFREDLYYRLNVVPITLPTLRERKEDIPLLANYFLDKYSKELNSKVKAISPEAQEVLDSYPWPGNVRELENIIERVLTLATHSNILPEDLPGDLRAGNQGADQVQAQSTATTASSGVTLPQAVQDLEKELIVRALNDTDWEVNPAADKLGVTRRILKYKMDTLGIKAKKVLDSE
ncbi:sigma-54 interaction domain-containing protein, partial [Candidatus Omnitrophota bacterium]